jgi:hypothetical protein
MSPWHTGFCIRVGTVEMQELINFIIIRQMYVTFPKKSELLTLFAAFEVGHGVTYLFELSNGCF